MSALSTQITITTPSKKKKTKGKAKAAANNKNKAAKKVEEESQVAKDDQQQQSGPLEAQTQRLKIDNETQNDDDDAFLEEAIKLAAAEKKELKKSETKATKILMAQNCRHGCDPLPKGSNCVGFINTFSDEHNAAIVRNNHPVSVISDACKAASEKYPDIDDSDKLWIVSFLLADGTKNILDGETEQARLRAATAILFEQLIVQTQPSLNGTKMVEMIECDEHTLVKYFRKSIPCKCLDEKYKEVMSITKMGVVLIQSAVSPAGRWNANPCCTAFDVATNIIVLVNVKRLHGRCTKSGVVTWIADRAEFDDVKQQS